MGSETSTSGVRTKNSTHLSLLSGLSLRIGGFVSATDHKKEQLLTTEETGVCKSTMKSKAETSKKLRKQRLLLFSVVPECPLSPLEETDSTQISSILL
jgi:hypothetical protein